MLVICSSIQISASILKTYLILRKNIRLLPNFELRAEKLRGAKVDENVHACCVANFFAPLCVG